MIQPDLIIYPLELLHEGIQVIVVAYFTSLGLAVPAHLSHPVLLFILLSSGSVSLSLLGTILTTNEIIHLITYGVTFIISFN